jgi:multidrug resistance efflux pump
MRRQIFRNASIERLTSPEELDQVIAISVGAHWYALLAALVLCAAALVWAVRGASPTIAIGTGLFTGELIDVSTGGAGVVRSIDVAVGQHVDAGQVVATIAPAVLTGRTDAWLTIVAPRAGRVVELQVSRDATVPAGAPLLGLECDSPPVEVLTFVPSLQTRDISPGQAVRVSPLTMTRRDHGFIHGKVVSVSDDPVTSLAAARATSAERVIAALTSREPLTAVRVALDRDSRTASGLRWSSGEGPPAGISAGTLARVHVVARTEGLINLLVPSARQGPGH